MKKLYIQIFFLLAISCQYVYAQVADPVQPLIYWPMNKDQSVYPNKITDVSGTATATVYSKDTSTPATSVFYSNGRNNPLNNPIGEQVLDLTNSQFLGGMGKFFGAFSGTVPDELTVSFWMYHNTTDMSRRGIFTAGDGFGLDIQNNTLYLKRKDAYRNSNSEFAIVESKPVFDDPAGDGWYFVTLSYSRFFFRLYIGRRDMPQLACSYQWMGTFQQALDQINNVGQINVIIGSKRSGVSTVEQISDFRVYGIALSKEQVNNLFLDDAYMDIDVRVYKNNARQSSLITDAKVGDEILFSILSPSPDPPVIENLPQTWIARSAGDTRYFVSGSFKPGKSRPWIGFDTQVHWLNLRHFEQEPGRVNYPGWVRNTLYDDMYIHSIKYIVSAPMKPYDSPPGRFQWDKFSQAAGKNKVLSDDKKFWLQRANQKEGLNMQVLHYWNQGLTAGSPPNYTSTYSGAPFMMGFDDDEILYMSTPCHNTTGTPCDGVGGGTYAILKEPLGWQSVPVYETASEDETVNAMVSAYYQSTGEFSQGQSFPGNEIQDYGTNKNALTGTGTWMHQDGNIRITIPATGEEGDVDKTYRIGINAESPLKSFYTIKGPTVVARNERVNYTLTPFDASVNFKQIINDYTDRGYEVTLEYETQDSFGSVKHDCDILPAPAVGLWTSESGKRTSVCTHQVYSTNPAKTRNAMGANPFESMVDNLPLIFEIKTFGDSYCTVSLYLNKTDGDPTKSVRILLAGKEINAVNLAFLEDQNLNDGTGEGGYFFVEQQRTVAIPAGENNANGSFNVKRGDKFVAPFVRTYTFYHGQSSKWKVWDSDPHMFAGAKASPDHDWYQGDKKLSQRVTDEDIESGQLVKYYFDPLSRDLDGDGFLSITPDGSGDTEVDLAHPVSMKRFWDVTYNSGTHPAGEYQLTAVFRNGPPIQHKIVIKPERVDAGSPFAEIKSYTLGAYDKALLRSAGMALSNGTTYKVIEITNISSNIMYVVGQRNNYRNGLTGIPNSLTTNIKDPSGYKFAEVNRWGSHNDYTSRFYWISSISELAIIPPFQFSDATNPWNFDLDGVQKPLQGTSDKDFAGVPPISFPIIWGNHFSSLWKGDGPDGQAGPIYAHTSAMPGEESIDFSIPFLALAMNGAPKYWQYRATLNSWADNYGYRMRYNPSHIYSLERVFDRTNGAFSGASVPGQYEADKASRPRQPYPSDNFLNLQAWYWNLSMGRKIIVSESHYNTIKNTLFIRNDFNVEYGKLASPAGYASTNKITHSTYTVDGVNTHHTISGCGPCALTEVTYATGNRLAAVEDVKADDVKMDEDYTPSLSVYPNSVDIHNQLNISVTATGLSPMYFGVYDLTGRILFEQSSVVDRGVNQFTFNPSDLGVQAAEMVMIRVITDELNDTKKIIITKSSDKK